MNRPIPVRVIRYRCPHCARSHSARARCVEHMARCWSNPGARGCKTCAHFQAAQPAEIDTGWPGEPEGCASGVDLTGRPACEACGGTGYRPDTWDSGKTCAACAGDPEEVKPGPIVGCDQWKEVHMGDK